jgi:hypothetical protein
VCPWSPFATLCIAEILAGKLKSPREGTRTEQLSQKFLDLNEDLRNLFSKGKKKKKIMKKKFFINKKNFFLKKNGRIKMGP